MQHQARHGYCGCSPLAPALSCAGRSLPKRPACGHCSWLVRVVRLLVRLEHWSSGAFPLDVSALEPHHPVTDLGDLVEAVAHEDHSPTLAMQALDLLDTAQLELAVHDREHLVEDV